MRPVTRRRGHYARSRRGFSIIELLIGMILTSMVMGAVVAALVRQQRFYRGTAALVETRSQIRQAAMILTGDLRGISTENTGSDLIEIAQNSLVFRGTFGTSVVCVRNGNSIIVPPTNLASGNVLTSWSMTPAVGDTVLIFDDGGTVGGVDDLWQPYAITAVSEVQGGCPASTSLTTAADEASNSYQFVLSGAPAATTLNRPVRFTRVMRYALYQAGDGDWYLGYCSPTCGVGGWEPVAGPLLPQAAGSAGLALTYQDENGVATSTRADVARIGVAVRGQTRTSLNIEGMRTGPAKDSLHVVVGIRNRRR